MKGEFKVILVASICASLIGVVDALASAYIFHSGSFLDLFLFNVPPHDLAFRIFTVILILILGIISAYFTRMRRLQREEIQKNEEALKLRAEMLDNIADSVFLREVSGTILYVNKTAFESRGYTREELLGKPLFITLADEEVDRVKTLLHEIIAKKNLIFETIHKRKDGTTFPVEVHARVLQLGDKTFVLSIIRDISFRRSVQEKILIADRLSSLGKLVMGLSHELNNPLTSVIGYSQLLMRKQEIPRPVRDDIEKINSQANRAADIIKNFTLFGREYTAEKQFANINEIIRSVLDLRNYELKSKSISVTTSLDPEIPPVRINIGQMQQVFLNIILNSEYFTHEAHQKGTLHIITKKADNSIRITIKDDGPGIKPENLLYIFDPFYSTREVGKGMGIGLTIAYRIVIQHGGKLDIESQPEKGTTVIIELPVNNVEYSKTGGVRQ
jgi:PAS domain S-box-containing protein